MASLEIDFEWYLDPEGYQLLAAEEPKPVTSRNALGAIMRGEFTVSQVAFPPWLASQPVSLKPERIVRHGGDLQPYRPLQRFDSLFQIFANSGTSADGVLHFIERFGPLTQTGLDPKVGEPVSLVISHAEAMSRILKVHSGEDEGITLARVLRGRTITLGSIQTALTTDSITGDLRMQLTVPDLLTGLWVQLGQSLASGAAMRICDHCNMPFEVGPGTGRRLDAKFCSDEHRVTFNSLKRSKGAKADA
jgi:hypothetical protein